MGRAVKTLAVGVILVLVLGAAVRTGLVRAILHPPDRYGLPTDAVTADDVSQHPEAHLSYPGAVDRDEHVEGEQDPILGPTKGAARADLSFRAHASSATIVAWYRRWYLAHGWGDDPSGPPIQPLIGDDGLPYPYLLSMRRDTRELANLAAGLDPRRRDGWTRVYVEYAIQPAPS